MMKRSAVRYRIKSVWPTIRRFRLFTITVLLISATAVSLLHPLSMILMQYATFEVEIAVQNLQFLDDFL
jgi:cell division protein FtsL